MLHKLDLTYLEQLRSESKLTLQEISELSGVPLGSVKRIFSGATENPTASNTADIIDSMGGSMDDAFGLRIKNSDHATNNPEILERQFEKALQSSRDSYKNACDHIRASFNDEIHMLNKTISEKNHWLRALFVYAIIVTIFAITILIMN